MIKLLREAPSNSILQLVVQSPNSVERGGWDRTIRYGLNTNRLIRIRKSALGGGFGFAFMQHYSPIHVVLVVNSGSVAERCGLEMGERILEM